MKVLPMQRATKENPELKIVWIPGIKDCLIIHMH